MGSNESMVLLGDSNWELAQHRQGYTIVRNINSSVIGQCHTVAIVSLQHEVDLYSWRRHVNCKNIISIHGMSVNKNQQSLCQQQSMYMKVITQHPTTRLTDVQLLNDKEIVKVLLGCLQGLKVLTNKFGYFRISPKMIGLTKDGQVKIWINSDFSLNWIEQDIIQQSSKTSNDKLQNFMIQQLIGQLKIKAQNPRFVDELKQQMIKQRVYSFEQTEIFLQQYWRKQVDYQTPSISTIQRRKMIENEILGKQQSDLNQINKSLFLSPQRMQCTRKISSQFSPPSTVKHRGNNLQHNQSLRFNRNYIETSSHPTLLRVQQPSTLLNRVKSQQRLPPFLKPTSVTPSATLNRIKSCSNFYKQKPSSTSTTHALPHFVPYTPVSTFTKPLPHNHYSHPLNFYKQRSITIPTLPLQADTGVFVMIDDDSQVTTTSRQQQKPDDYIQIVGQ